MRSSAFVRRTLPAAIILAAVAGLGCRSGTIRVTSLDEVERIRASPAFQGLGSRAAEVLARAERERDTARAAHAAGDDTAANLHAEWAMAAYEHALAVARLSTAVSELADAQKSLDDATAQEQPLAASRAKLELEAEDLERRAQTARQQLPPDHGGDSSEDREAARRSSARSLSVEARLLCGAALLVEPDTAGVADAEGAIEKLDAGLANHALRDRQDHHEGDPDPGATVVDEAGAARARCLRVLTRARRSAGDDGGRADALLSELSASGGWDPTRDERGVVVTLRGAFQGTKLTGEGEAKLASLGRVASSHPGFAVQVVLHDAQSPSAKDDGDAQRSTAVVKALLSGGAPAAHVKAELAGTGAPLVDPSNPKLRIRNERLDVVFVAGS